MPGTHCLPRLSQFLSASAPTIHPIMPRAETLILRELLTAERESVSGARLAQLLGVSRVAVWMHLQKLQKQGFRFEALRGRGYRLVERPAGLHPDLVLAQVPGRRSSLNIVCLDTVDSTNSEAERQLAAGAEVPLVIISRQQTQGRGRRGRVWHSAANGNLYCTFVFRPSLAPSQLQDFTLWMGLQLCCLIANFCKIEPALKWPNDLFIGGRKAGGLLTEARVDADQVRDLVLGVGLNLNSRVADLPRDLQRTATTLRDATGEAIDTNRFAAALIGRVLNGYNSYLDGSYRESFSSLWERYDVLRGRNVTVVQDQRTRAGTAEGIDGEGALVLRLADGTTERFRAGEVTLSGIDT